MGDLPQGEERRGRSSFPHGPGGWALSQHRQRLLLEERFYSLYTVGLEKTLCCILNGLVLQGILLEAVLPSPYQSVKSIPTAG